jgi:hypothetical protein
MNGYETDTYCLGDVVLASVYNTLENRNSRGKVRPVVLTKEDGGHWLVAGLTTSPRRKNGEPRMAIPNPLAVGLRGPGHLWGNRLHNVSKIDLGRTIGHADAALALLIADTHDMSKTTRARLLATCGVELLRPEAC